MPEEIHNKVAPRRRFALAALAIAAAILAATGALWDILDGSKVEKLGKRPEPPVATETKPAENKALSLSLAIIKRKADAEVLQNAFLDQGMDVSVTVTGSRAQEIDIQYILANAVMARRLFTSGILAQLEVLGFEKVTLWDGHEYGAAWQLHPAHATEEQAEESLEQEAAREAAAQDSARRTEAERIDASIRRREREEARVKWQTEQSHKRQEVHERATAWASIFRSQVASVLAAAQQVRKEETLATCQVFISSLNAARVPHASDAGLDESATSTLRWLGKAAESCGRGMPDATAFRLEQAAEAINLTEERLRSMGIGPAIKAGAGN